MERFRNRDRQRRRDRRTDGEQDREGCGHCSDVIGELFLYHWEQQHVSERHPSAGHNSASRESPDLRGERSKHRFHENGEHHDQQGVLKAESFRDVVGEQAKDGEAD
jgi:hypothetical protein